MYNSLIQRLTFEKNFFCTTADCKYFLTKVLQFLTEVVNIEVLNEMTHILKSFIKNQHISATHQSQQSNYIAANYC